MRKGNLTVTMIFDLDKEDQLWTAVQTKLQELRTANIIDKWIMDGKEETYSRRAEG